MLILAFNNNDKETIKLLRMTKEQCDSYGFHVHDWHVSCLAFCINLWFINIHFGYVFVKLVV